MKTRAIFIVSATCLGAALLFGCVGTNRTGHKIDVAIMMPVPLNSSSEANAEALKRIKEADLDPDAISQNAFERQTTVRDVRIRGQMSSEGATLPQQTVGQEKPDSAAPSASTTPFTGAPALNSRYQISNLADLYEWRIANELRFRFEKTFGDRYELYCIPAIISVMPDGDTLENCYVRVTCRLKPASSAADGDSVRLLAIAPFRQFDNRAETLAQREQFLLTLAAAGAAKAGAGNASLEGYYKLMKQWEKDFSQILKVPVMTSFIENDQKTFGWNIYPSFVISEGDVRQQMINDCWHVYAIIAVKSKTNRETVRAEITTEWLLLPECRGKQKNLKETFEKDLETYPALNIYSAVPVSDRIIKLTGTGLNMIEVESVKVTMTGSETAGTKNQQISASPKINSAGTAGWLVLDKDLKAGNGYLLEAAMGTNAAVYTFFNYDGDRKQKGDDAAGGNRTNSVDLKIDLKASQAPK